MDTVTYPDSRVAALVAHHFVPVQVKIKEQPGPVEAYFVRWTPTVLVLDEKGRPHYRLEGYLPPKDFLGRLSLGLGRYWFNMRRFADAESRFQEVVQFHQGTEAGAEALYWLAVTQYKQSHDPAKLMAGWRKLAAEYPDSEWGHRAQVPRPS